MGKPAYQHFYIQLDIKGKSHRIFCILTSFALTNAATILVQFETIDTVFFSQSAVHQNLTGGWTYCDVCWF